MTSAMHRLPAPWGRRLNRKQPVRFEFCGKTVTAYDGDTVTSAILGAPDQPDYLARSFKYHRPRSVLLGNGSDANQYVQADGIPNISADDLLITDGIKVSAQNVFGSLTKDKGAALNALTRFLPPGFYYDAFFRPKGIWPVWEKIIRQFAGLGVLNPDMPHEPSEKLHLFCEVAVIGGGISGMSAALRAADLGCDVVLIEQDNILGGMSNDALLTDEEMQRLSEMRARVEKHPKIEVLLRTFCAGWFEGNLLTAHGKSVYYHVRADQVIAATGVCEQPLVFRNNDLPGILLSSTANRLLNSYGICPGRKAVIQTANRFGYETALLLQKAGCQIGAIVDMRAVPEDQKLIEVCRALGIEIIIGASVTEAQKSVSGSVAGVTIDRINANGSPQNEAQTLSCDTFITSVGFTPLMQLLCHSGGEVIYDLESASLKVSKTPENCWMCGTVNQRFSFSSAILDGMSAGAQAASKALPEVANASGPAAITDAETNINFPFTIFQHAKGKEFVDFDEDQTVKDIQQAVSAGFSHMELMKRFTTVGMGPSQGRTTALNALRVFAAAANMDLGKVRITTQRPPFRPEPFANIAADTLLPQRRTVLHDWHLKNQAVMMPAGNWLRPAFYGDRNDEAKRVDEEVKLVRKGVGLIDASTHGGFRLFGLDCLKLLSVAYINSFDGFEVGQTKSALMTDELGAIVDDCFACRLDEGDIYLATSSGASAVTNRRLRKLIIEHGLNVQISELSGGYSVLNLAGPLARSCVADLESSIDFTESRFPLHAFREGIVAGIPVLIIRGNFIGEVTYEFHVETSYAVSLWNALMKAGEPHGIKPFGILSQRILRLEKAHILIGQDTDHETPPDAIGWADRVAVNKPYFLGKSAIELTRTKPVMKCVRPFERMDGESRVPEENRLLMQDGKMIGRITSAAFSPTLGKVIGLALLDDRDIATGSNVEIWGDEFAGTQLRLLDAAPYDAENTVQLQ